MDCATVAQLDVDKIPQALESGGWSDRWNRLVEFASDDAAHLLKLVCGVTPPERICELRDLETGQAERGAQRNQWKRYGNDKPTTASLTAG